MSLRIEAIDRLFQRLAATYGSSWTNQWRDVPVNDVKAAWAHELSVFAGSMARIAWALENLPERCPNAVEFKRLCYQAPAPEEKQLPAPKADPERVKAELAKLGHVHGANRSTGQRADMKDWARRIVARHEAGDRITPVSLKFAREALQTEVAA